MITRAYVITMATGGEGGGDPDAPVDILIQDAPGAQTSPVVTADGAEYYEWRGRPVRFETTAADGVAGGFVPLMNLGLTFAITAIGSTPAAAVPAVQLSESLATLAADIGAAFPDPGGEPAIRLTGSSAIEGRVYLLTVQIAQAQDEDQAPRRNG